MEFVNNLIFIFIKNNFYNFRNTQLAMRNSSVMQLPTLQKSFNIRMASSATCKVLGSSLISSLCVYLSRHFKITMPKGVCVLQNLFISNPESCKPSPATTVKSASFKMASVRLVSSNLIPPKLVLLKFAPPRLTFN